MRGVVLVSGLAKEVYSKEGYDVIGIDYGAFVCAKENIRMKAAIGDFDSVNEEQFEMIKTMSDEVEKLSVHKDETDTEKAILYAIEKGYEDIILCGALGGRMDHELANLYLMMYRGYPITIVNQNNRMRVLTKGVYQIHKEYTYLSILPIEPSCISEEGVAYPLEKRTITCENIYTISNEILNETAIITVHDGKVLLIESKD